MPVFQESAEPSAAVKKSPMRFILSNTQKKDLLIRNTPILVALPAPAEDPEDWLTWARESIIDQGDCVTFACPELLTVAPSPGRAGLDGFFGQIVSHARIGNDVKSWDVSDDPSMAHKLTLRVDAVICYLEPTKARRACSTRPAWPGIVLHNNQQWPPAVEDQP